MKKILLPLFALAMAFTACDDDPSVPVLPPDPVEPADSTLQTMGYVLNQGSYYSGIDGTLDLFNPANGTYISNAFASANGQSLGDSPQSGVLYGSNLYVAMYGSNIVWALDRATLRIKAMIPSRSPEGICAARGYVFVSNNDGYVTRIDTASLQVVDSLAVGPNPAQMVTAGGSVYVSISDGYNYANNYANGFRVVRIDPSAMTKVAEIPVGMNPGPLCADTRGNVFVVARGNYGDVAPNVWRITPDNQSSIYCPGSLIACHENLLYVVYNYTNWNVTPAETTLEYNVYDLNTGRYSDDIYFGELLLPEVPTFLTVHPKSGDIYMGSNASPTDYTSPGYLWRYDSRCNYINRYNAGVAPCAIVF